MLLINPASEQFGGIFARYVPVGIPVAIGTLAAFLGKFGHVVKVADDEIQKIDSARLDELVQGLPHPYVFGISVLTAQASRAYELVGLLKRKYPDCTVILGGIHATALPEEGLRQGADFVVRGEGELPLRELYEALREGRDPSGIRGLSFLRPDGRVQHNQDGLILEILDEIPAFPHELFPEKKYDRGFITSARGCPYKCSYCSQRLMTGFSYRFKSARRVVEELSVLIYRYGHRGILFYDDNFSFQKRRVVDLCDAIVAEGLHTQCEFSIQTRADNLYEEIMPHLRRANFTSVGFGMETGVERLARRIQKDETVEQHIKSIQLARKWGLDVSVFMIFGLPDETAEDRRASYRLIRQLDLKFTKFNNLIPYPGTTLYKEIKDSPQIRVAPLWSNFNSTLAATRPLLDANPLPYVPEGTTPWDLKRDIFRANISFYLTPRILLNVFRRKRGVGFILLPERWYLRPGEWKELARVGSIVLYNFFLTLLPRSWGAALYRRAMRRKGVPQQADPAHLLPDAVDGTMRKIRMWRRPKLLQPAEGVAP